ncbi:MULTISPECIES: class I adenylate-forming enzyme family protein [Halorubrum]|uniref:Long-chain fatty acid--CoA ligase n=1 Tax=Halorubrum tropicale TaxID=1765655 RepID=A0A0M9AN64_9EURY|nr:MULTISPECIES: AMP-binding protein [Halorubrum]KOX95449.1 long-chain fatty acid--CoA ligase [Halorubrum tropicale]MDB2238995.1 AMP-binding protein [Halorubrum ezzemoulense]MDB2249732.1 AMP-binding protein [Halorubrum ezzemoulense]
MKLREAFARTVRCYPNKTAIITDSGRSFTYATLDERSTRLANALHHRIGDGRCAVLAHNGHPAVESMLANNKRGVGTAQLSNRAAVSELERMVETGSARALLFDDANAETALELLDRVGFEVAIHAGERDIDHDLVESYETVVSDADHSPVQSVGDECGILYTSGTTSAPKAVTFDQEQLWYGAIQVVMEHGIDETDTALCTTPWYHMVTTDAWIYPHLVAGATIVLHTSFDPTEALSLIEEHNVSGLLAVPTQLKALIPVQQERAFDVDSLGYIRTGGSIVTEDLVADTTEHLTDQVYNTYGMTEAGPDLTFAHPSVQEDHPGTIGKESFSWEIRVVETAPLDEHPDPEATVDAGERGEIIARGPGMSDGYIDNPEAEAKSYFDGWLRTRDVATVDEDDYLYIVDRVDNMIVSGGENVYPTEVETALESHPDVEEVCVFGLNDDQWGQVVTAVVVTDTDLTAEQLDEYCLETESLADFKRPREYAVTSDPLARSDTGTVVRSRLVEKHFPDR